jgi:hypothetical protein
VRDFGYYIVGEWSVLRSDIVFGAVNWSFVKWCIKKKLKLTVYHWRLLTGGNITREDRHKLSRLAQPRRAFSFQQKGLFQLDNDRLNIPVS